MFRLVDSAKNEVEFSADEGAGPNGPFSFAGCWQNAELSEATGAITGGTRSEI